MKCKTCSGRGKVVSDCLTCLGTCHVTLVQSWHACLRCGNRRCLSCGGSGVDPQPEPEKLVLV